MNAVIIDDEPLVLKMTAKAVSAALPSADIHTFTIPSKLLEFAENNDIDIAFLDIKMRGMTGLEIAKRLHDIHPKLDIIFVTAYDEYKSDAMDLHASGYLMKPVVAENVKNELKYLRLTVDKPETEEKSFLEVSCFGDFKVSCEGKPIVFDYSKTYELFAYLIDKKGAMCSYPLILDSLWEDMGNHLPYLKRLRADLLDKLTKIGMQDVLILKRALIGLDTNLIKCDYYDFLDNKAEAIAAYQGIYMEQFSWAEETNGALWAKKTELSEGWSGIG